MEIRYNRKAIEEGILRLVRKCDFRLLKIIWELLKYVMGEED